MELLWRLMGVDATIQSLWAQGGDINKERRSSLKDRKLGDYEKLEGAPQALLRGVSLPLPWAFHCLAGTLGLCAETFWLCKTNGRSRVLWNLLMFECWHLRIHFKNTLLCVGACLGDCICLKAYHFMGFPGSLVLKNPSVNAGDSGSVSGLGRSPGEGNGNPLQYSCLRESHGQRSLEGSMGSQSDTDWARKHYHLMTFGLRTSWYRW